jgi:uncharacterized protein YcnI
MIRKLLVAAAALTGLVALTTGSAFAHVEIEREGQAGRDGSVGARLSVPNEEPDAGTVRVELVFPDSPGITDATAGPVEGWTAAVEKDASGDVERVTWTGGPITGETEAEFPVTLGPVPDGTEEIEFTALQTYDTGEVVRWVEPTQGGDEPEHPAPVLLISGEASAHDDSGGAQDDGLSTPAIVMIVVALIVVLGLIFWLLSRRRASSPTA